MNWFIASCLQEKSWWWLLRRNFFSVVAKFRSVLFWISQLLSPIQVSIFVIFCFSINNLWIIVFSSISVIYLSELPSFKIVHLLHNDSCSIKGRRRQRKWLNVIMFCVTNIFLRICVAVDNLALFSAYFFCWQETTMVLCLLGFVLASPPPPCY